MKRSSDLFLMSLLSDTMLDPPRKQMLSELSLSPEIRGVRTGADAPYSDAFKITKTYEAGDGTWRAAVTNRNGGAQATPFPRCSATGFG
jgi:hypothetical protein